jgi:uncharacterized coiled-coil protein SlyX|tara:strand:+ start:575 stop:781 length:207 start_codon:yes stop_codon:yes gene_type:complete
MKNSITIPIKDWNELKENIAKQEPTIMELKEIIDTQRQQLDAQIKKKEDFIAKQDELIQQLFNQLNLI